MRAHVACAQSSKDLRIISQCARRAPRARRPKHVVEYQCTGLAEASKDQALIGKGVQVSLQGAALRCRCPVVDNINGVELGLGDPTEPLGPSLSGLGACRPVTVSFARVDALQLVPPGGKG